MRVLLSWLREFAPLDASVDELADTMSDLGLTVEDLDVVGEPVEGVVVARVVELRPHPRRRSHPTGGRRHRRRRRGPGLLRRVQHAPR